MSDNPFLKRIEARGKSGHGKLSEERVAKSIGARLTPASGALRGCKGDMGKTVAGKKWKMEAKSTIHGTLSLDLGWLVKIATEALNTGATPALTISFVGPDGRAKKHGDWIAIPRADWDELTGE